MISRRNIRVKVMQSLYALHTGNDPSVQESKPGSLPAEDTKHELSAAKAAAILRRHFDQTNALFTYQIWFLTEVARYAETDAHQRAGKHLPSMADLSVAVKVAGNELLWRMLESPFFQESVGKYKPALQGTQEWVKNIYQQLTETTEYAVYNSTDGRDRKSEKEILEFIYMQLMLGNDEWVEHVEDLFSNWDDDAEMLQMLVLNFIQKPQTFRLEEMVSPDKFAFAEGLLETTYHRTEQLDEIIKPKLRNWDAERLALIDIILLEMGVCEFLYFETIPPKVTINEYIDLAKDYSTSQSGQFVNGILDNIRKELESGDKMHKVAFHK